MKHLIVDFVAGFLISNSIPHLSAGLRGELFPTPFAKPPGVGLSHPSVNVVWGVINGVLAVLFLQYMPIAIGLNSGFMAVVLGALIGGALIANYFYHWRQRNASHQSDDRK